ncbi:MAG: sulfatase [Pirellula sp.]
MQHISASRFWMASILVFAWVHSNLQAADRPNVVWLISEDNSVHYLKLYSQHGTETPRIAELTAHGLQYKHAFSNAPVCSVARTTLITGCYGPRIGTQFHRRAVSVPMPDGIKMFPAYLREGGYFTSNNQKKDYNADETRNTWNESSGKASWRSRAPNQPFFHMQSFTTTHESSLHFTEESMANQRTETDPKGVHVAPYHPDTHVFRYTVAKYHDNIRKVDKEIGEVVDRLAQEGLLEDTFIFYFGDHGGVLPRGKGYAYESGLHVPLVVRVPNNYKHLVKYELGSKPNAFVQFVDLSATVLHLAGIEMPKGIDGRPFLGTDIDVKEVEARDEAFGYADRFDEKYDLVRTLRKGRYEYVRSYQPFNFDGLQNNYRYNMLAYREWRTLYHEGKLNDSQSQFFRTRPAEMLFDIESDPYEVNNLANRAESKPVLESMRQLLQVKVKSLPDLSFYPENYLAANAFRNPVRFGAENKSEVSRLIEIADLSLSAFPEVKERLENILRSSNATERYWGCIVCSCFGQEAKSLAETAKTIAAADQDLLVRTRAAEFLGLISVQDPRPTLMDCLAKSNSAIQCNVILNSAVLLHSGRPGYKFAINGKSINESFVTNEEVGRRLTYFEK